MSKPKVQYRVVCQQFGRKGVLGHKSHAYTRPSLAKAQKSVAYNNEQGYTLNTPYYEGETPWRIERREVTAWEEVSR